MRGDGVYVGPHRPQELLEAVTRGGGRHSPVEEASAVVWYGGTPEQFAQLAHPGIRWVQLPAAGVEPWFRARVITPERVFTSAAGSYAPSVAEHTLGLLLTGARRLHELARARTWTRPAPASVRGSTVAIVGCGGIGRALIELLAPFEVRVLAITRSGRDVPGAAVSTHPQNLHDVLREADYVVVAAPSTTDTRYLIGAPELAVMGRESWLVNVARGSLVDTDALVAALRDGRIGGAALDVTEPEPLPDGHPLWDEPRAIITPHSANPPNLLLPQLADRVQRNVERFLAGRELEGIVDLRAGY
jgi:phosphoglycerate dehydrogenase-like enzyme